MDRNCETGRDTIAQQLGNFLRVHHARVKISQKSFRGLLFGTHDIAAFSNSCWF